MQMSLRHLWYRCLFVLFVSVAAARGLAAQNAQLAVPAAAPPTASYQARFDEAWAMAPMEDQGAAVHNLVITREQASLELTDGRLALLTPIEGQAVGAVWEGTGRFRMNVDHPGEQQRLKRFFGSTSLDIPITSIVFFFSDSTGAELGSKLTLGTIDVSGDMRRSVQEALDYVGDKDTRALSIEMMGLMLQSSASGLFYAHMTRPKGDPFMLMVNPNIREGVRLMSRAKNVGWTRVQESVAQVPRAGETAFPPGEDRINDVEIERYMVETTLTNAMSGDVSFAARATMALVADQPVSGWAPFYLYEKLKVDSARWGDGEPATVFKVKDSYAMWVRLPRKLVPGDSLMLTVAYHGDMTERFLDWFAIRSSTAWYPQAVEGRSKAIFDLTFHNPKAFAMVSVGDMKDSTVSGSVLTTRWVTPAPIRNAGFNFGMFETHTVRPEGVPPITVLWSDRAHQAFSQMAVQGKNMDKQVGADMAGSMQFYQKVFGNAPVDHFYATEIPYSHGEAFPGLVHLSYATFVQQDNTGNNEWFRAHEVAHQWWGIGVDFATYRDQWLSEGFSSFAGLWYMQVAKKDTKPYFAQLRRWKADILANGAKAGPISMGWRVTIAREGGVDYQTVVYYKGAWVLHMLRTLMIDFKTMNEDRFTNMMRDFYQTYEGKYASTADFQRTVEKHTNTSMNWFFDQWVRGALVPKYSVQWKVVDAPEGKFQVRLKVAQEGVPETFQMYVPVTMQLSDGSVVRMRVLVKGPGYEGDLPAVPSRPKDFIFNDFEGVLADVQVEHL